MSTRLRVRDLATELDISSKDLMTLLRELKIPAKSHMSSLTDEEVDQVRNHHRNRAATPQVVDTRATTGVIVRKRHKVVAEAATAADDTPIKDKAPAEAPPQAPAEVVAETDEAAAKPKARKSSRAVIVAPARIIEEAPSAEGHAVKPAAEEAPEIQVSAETATAGEPAVTADEAPEKPVATKAVESEDSVEAKDGVATSAETPADADNETEEAKRARKKTKKAKPAPASVQVKIISRPTIVEFPDTRVGGQPVRPMGPAARPMGPAGYTPRPAGPARPSGPAGPRPGAPRPAGPPDLGAPPRPAPENEGSRDARGKKKKGRRTVEAADLYRKEEFSMGKGKKAQRAEARRAGGARAQQQITQPLKASKRKIRIDDTIRLTDLAHQMGIKAQDLIKKLFLMGVMATINQSLDFETALLLAAEFKYEVERAGFSEDEFLLPKEADKAEDLKPRPPVVTIMGHVDHGKTSLLDAIRSTSVADGEAGGITQHIGAYHVATSRGEVVFLDTPGHEAFTTMRARGAKVTDIVVLVVAADDGVMEQTREAVSHSKAAGVPIVVAVNKMDKEGADPDRVKRELSDLGLMPEDWGGDTIYAHVSAKKREGLDELLELILLQAEVLDLKANPDKPGRGHVVEAKLDKGRGPVGTVLIQEGQISQGDAFVCGLISGKVRAMFDDQGRQIKSAGPAIPAEIQGFEAIPEAGDEFVIVKDEKVARKIAEDRRVKHRDKELAKESKVTLESFLASKAGEEAQNLNLLLKADVQGSLEAISEALRKLSTDEVKIVLLHGGAGAITESDILLASASNAIIIGFNIRPTAKIKEVAEQEKVDIRFYDIIYKLVDDIKAAMSGMLSPDIKEVYLGQADVQQVFSVPKIGNIAGCMVSDGKLKRNASIRLLRNGVVIYTGKLSSLKRFKDDAKEVTKGYDCGAGLENFNDIKMGDIIEAFELVEEARTI
ncbi:MAG: translation initiation factor IF-2 [Desulfomicrobium sp.]|nr:translation initiation factor IF-2 [Pseudomonadota bacterium]MBV1714225.1 translation initiation factor IF-2 [Desulfomicrobium sp.]MBU4570964.1 translation initiation factor IF-2 [Pseudomonadota bacterium]MBU4594582.1 translation initiation factor IF-2 [Pseudomonadota bacterium]MBV1718393.1 translation initiation factor IF-2 [Desulfomicrobium sp.]